MNQVSLEELLSQAVDVARSTRRDEAPSPCVDCKSEVAILPLRYAVVTSEDPEALAALAPDLPRNLGLGLPALQAKGVRYAVRAMRQGYLYAFIKRLGKWNCESAWRATGTGVFSPFWPYSPDLQYAPEPRRLLGYGGWTILFKAPEDIQEARLLFTPDVLTERMLDKLRDTDSLRNKLQAFDIKEIASSCSFAPDVLDMSSTNNGIAESIAAAHTRLAPTLADQLHSDPDYHHAPQLVASDLRPTVTRARGAAIVLRDPIGITQQLNAWRNEAVETLKDYLNRGGANNGISNERKILVAQAFGDVRNQFEERSAALEAQHYIEIERDKVFNPEMARGRNWILDEAQQKRWEAAAQEHVRNYEATIRARVQAKLDSGEYRARFESKYVTPPDPKAALQIYAMKQALAGFETQCRIAEKEAARRALPYEVWLQSEQLLDGLDVYDDADLASGWRFAGQTGLCVFGAEGCESSANVIQEWWQGRAQDRKNLALRSFGLNQDAILAEMDRISESAKSEPALAAGDTIYQYTRTGLEMAKTLGQLFDKANSVYEAMDKSSNAGLSGGVLAWYASLGRQTLRHASRGNEWFVHRATRSWLAASIGERAVNLRLEDLQAIGHSADRTVMRGQIKQNVQFAFATELVDARSSEFYKVRASGWLLLLEAGLLGLRMHSLPQDDRQRAELAAAVLTAGAAGIEMLACGTELVLRHFNPGSTTGVGATVFLGRLRLWGWALAIMGGAIAATYDLIDMQNAAKEKKTSLSRAFRVRFVTALLMATGQASLTLGAAAPMLRIVAERAVLSRWSVSLGMMADISAFFAKEAVALFFRRLLLRGTGILVVASVAIAIFDDDALQKWCKRTSYRGPKFQNEKPFEDTAQELASVYGALNEVA
ncbi:hypothetical protein LMG26686_00723 [Achromobacter mucicolens]|uniref:T6SS effector BTH_I2691 family protein n=1 Tax=Achromobacter mucicolens TaxID=1389922 RepID=UPI0014686036|nr:T6SS effector BTH_I2691 family protein [Achromobacter mucicolens]CAB3826378.1 hypothetical protein LMG26686_00723 [Achromobacter mucicolens]